MFGIDEKLNPIVHQIVGMAMGIIGCAWFVGATPEQVGIIRLPATVILTSYIVAGVVAGVWRWARTARGARRAG